MCCSEAVSEFLLCQTKVFEVGDRPNGNRLASGMAVKGVLSLSGIPRSMLTFNALNNCLCKIRQTEESKMFDRMGLQTGFHYLSCVYKESLSDCEDW